MANNTVSVVANDAPDYLLNKLLEWDGIVIDVSWPPGNQQVEITNDGILNITSNDWSINITISDWIADLSWCCDDKFVKVSANDTDAWYLSDKLTVEATWPLELTIQNVWHDEYYELSFDESKLIIDDELVAVESGKTPWYLDDIIVAWVGLITTVAWDNLDIDLDDTSDIWKRPCARRTLQRTFEITGITNGTTQTTAVNDAWSNYFWNYDITNDANMFATYDVITITKAWMYKVFLNGTAEINKWVAALRVFLATTNAWEPYPLDIRYGWPTTTWDYASGNALSLGYRAQRWNCSGFNFVNLDVWDILGLVVKASAEVDWAVEPGNAIDGKIRILAVWDDIEDAGFSFGVEYIGHII